MFTADVPADLMEPPVNVLRVSLHPDGMASRILNYGEWRAHLLERLRHQIDVTGDAVLARLMRELSSYPERNDATAPARGPAPDYAGVVVPLRLVTDGGVLSFFSTTTVFGTPVDVTLSELALETFFPADEATAQALRAGSPSSSASSETAETGR
jgi:hypothetical protein